MTRRDLAALALIPVLLAGCAPEPPPDGTPRLVLFLVIDQGRYDYLERFRPLLTHGLSRLLEESVVFTAAYHDHAISNTAPGHATLATGQNPSRHGIVNNWWFDRARGERVAAVGDPPSPEALLAPTLGDWLKSTYSRSKVFAGGGKDRAAIFTAGKNADGAYWTETDDGRFVGSRYYRRRDPAWLQAFNEERFPLRYFGQSWQPLPEVVEQGAAYGVAPLDRGTVERRFPHPIGPPRPAPSSGFFSALLNGTPYGDAYLAAFARALIEGEDLGADAFPDFLGLAFSAMDKIGHNFGPDSPELLDTLLRLDRALGEVLDFVDRRVGLENTLVSLSSDHGVTPLPELLAAAGDEARRFDAEETRCFQRARDRLMDRFGEHEWFVKGFYLDRRGAAEAAIDPAEIERETRRLIERCDGVARVWTRSELATAGGDRALADETMRRLYRHSFHPERSPDLLVQLEPHTLPAMRGIVTNHGTPYAYDTHVPWLLRLPSAQSARVDAAVATADIAPTLAHLLGVTPPADLAGVDRRSLLPADR